MKPQKEQRGSERQLCSDFVELRFPDQSGRWISATGVIEDVSLHGINVSLDIPMPVEAVVHLQTGAFVAEARVCYCNIGDYGYLVGLEFAEGYEWTQEKWQPKHLLKVPTKKK